MLFNDTKPYSTNVCNGGVEQCECMNLPVWSEES